MRKGGQNPVSPSGMAQMRSQRKSEDSTKTGGRGFNAEVKKKGGFNRGRGTGTEKSQMHSLNL